MLLVGPSRRMVQAVATTWSGNSPPVCDIVAMSGSAQILPSADCAGKSPMRTSPSCRQPPHLNSLSQNPMRCGADGGASTGTPSSLPPAETGGAWAARSDSFPRSGCAGTRRSVFRYVRIASAAARMVGSSLFTIWPLFSGFLNFTLKHDFATRFPARSEWSSTTW